VIGRRDETLDAAIRLLGTAGSRGLTHRGVDREAGLPIGSTSNNFRSRAALIAGILGRMEELDYQDWAQRNEREAVQTAAQLVDALTELVVLAGSRDRVRTQARYALFVEAAVAGDASPVSASIRRSRGNLLRWAADILGGLGVPSADQGAELMVDYLDGLILHQLTGTATDPPGVHAGIERMITALGHGRDR
jgi:DNA-binding transcriptional regulator YbjK